MTEAGSVTLYVEELVIKKDIGRLLLELEKLQQDQVEAATRKQETKVHLSPVEKREALKFLRDEKLIDRILADYDAWGLVGEDTNKLLCYLAVVSRKLADPRRCMVLCNFGGSMPSAGSTHVTGLFDVAFSAEL